MEELIASIDSLQLVPVVTLLVPVFLIMVGVAVVWQPLRRIRAYRRLQKLIRGLGAQWLRDVYVPGGIDGNIYIEYLLLMPNRLLLLHVKPYYGNIFAGEQIEYWTQVIGHHSFKFMNPLHQLQTTLGELRSVIQPRTELEGRVLFTAGSRFPKGKPDTVLKLEELRTMAVASSSAPAEALNTVWQGLVAAARPAGQIRLDSYLRRRDRSRLLYGGLLLVTATTILVWLLLA